MNSKIEFFKDILSAEKNIGVFAKFLLKKIFFFLKEQINFNNVIRMDRHTNKQKDTKALQKSQKLI